MMNMSLWLPPLVGLAITVVAVFWFRRGTASNRRAALFFVLGVLSCLLFQFAVRELVPRLMNH